MPGPSGQHTHILYEEGNGGAVEGVLDPDDPDVAIPVSTPTSWARHPVEESLWLVTCLAGAGLFAAWIAAKVLPEDRKRFSQLVRSLLSRPGTT